jgi:hypothetical protein
MNLVELLTNTTDGRDPADVARWRHEQVDALRRRVAELEARLRLGQCEACSCIEAGLRLLPRTTGLVLLAGRERDS